MIRPKSKPSWSNPDVLEFGQGHDPIEKMMGVATAAGLDAIQNGWKGPPFDPFRLAEHLKLKVVPREDVADARTVPVGTDEFRVEYNPSRPRQRIRFSIAHEIAHTFLPGCRDRIRYRAGNSRREPGEWELEVLCNVGAAELLMPTGSLPDFKSKRMEIAGLLSLRQDFEVSAESVALRYAKTTDQPMFAFVASPLLASHTGGFHINYAVSSRTWGFCPTNGYRLPENGVVAACIAIGQTSHGRETWDEQVGPVDLECVGLPPYSGNVFPRVLGLAYPVSAKSGRPVEVEFVIGDATKPSGTGPKLIAQVVNDKTPNWGAGFALAVRKAWTKVQEGFRRWAAKSPGNLRLGNVLISEVSAELAVASMVCQHGYGPSDKPRIRYVALQQCLQQLGASARDKNACVHMPRIGSGFGGGSWGLIAQLVDENLCRCGVPVRVYDLPGSKEQIGQKALFD